MTEEKDFFELSKEINKLVREGKAQIHQLRLKEEENETLKEKDDELDEYLKGLYKKAERIAEKMTQALGQMYCGVIIPESYSIRKDGKIYPYKCRTEVSEASFLKTIAKKKEYLKEKLNPKDYDIFVEFLDRIVKGDEFELEIDTSIADGKMPIPETEVFDYDRDYSDRTLDKGISRTINNMHFSKGNITFYDGENDYVNNRIIHKLLVQKFQKEIEKVREKVMNNLQVKKDFLDILDKDINDKLGKWIIVAQLNNDKIEKSDYKG